MMYLLPSYFLDLEIDGIGAVPGTHQKVSVVASGGWRSRCARVVAVGCSARFRIRRYKICDSFNVIPALNRLQNVQVFRVIPSFAGGAGGPSKREHITFKGHIVFSNNEKYP